MITEDRVESLGKQYNIPQRAMPTLHSIAEKLNGLNDPNHFGSIEELIQDVVDDPEYYLNEAESEGATSEVFQNNFGVIADDLTDLGSYLMEERNVDESEML